MFQLSERLQFNSANRPAAGASGTFALSRVIRECARRYVEYHAHAARKIQAAALIGVFCFPTFYFVWTYVLPQPYESILLRSIGAGLCLLLAVAMWWPAPARRYLVAFSYFTFLYCLPFYFTLMLLFNNSNATWQLSTLAALIYVVLLYDLVNAIIVLVIGSAAAVGAYLLATHGAAIPEGYWVTLPILVFALTGFLGLAYGDNVIAKEKLKAAASLASQVAHECRTPLTGIRFEADGCERLLSRLPLSLERDKLIASHRACASTSRPPTR